MSSPRALSLVALAALALNLSACTALYPEEPVPARLMEPEGGAAAPADMGAVQVEVPDQHVSPYTPLIDAVPCPVSDEEDSWQRSSGFPLAPIDAPALEGISPNVSTFSCPEEGCAAQALTDAELDALDAAPWLRAALAGGPSPWIERLRGALAPAVGTPDGLTTRAALPITEQSECPSTPFRFELDPDQSGAAESGAGSCVLYDEDASSLMSKTLVSGVPAARVNAHVDELFSFDGLDPNVTATLSLSDGLLTVDTPLPSATPTNPFSLTVTRSVVRARQSILVGAGSRVEVSDSTLYLESGTNDEPLFQVLDGGELILRNVVIVSDNKTINLKRGRVEATGVALLRTAALPPRAFSTATPFLDMSASDVGSSATLAGLYVGEGFHGPVVLHASGELTLTGVVTESIEAFLYLNSMSPDLRLTLRGAYLRARYALKVTTPDTPAADGDLCARPAPPTRLTGSEGVALSGVHVEGDDSHDEQQADIGHVHLQAGTLNLHNVSTHNAHITVGAGRLNLQEAHLRDSHIALRQPSSALRLLNVRAEESDPLELRPLIENHSGEALARYITWAGGATLIEHPEQASPSNAHAVSDVCHARLAQGAAPPFRHVFIAFEGDLTLTDVVATSYEGFIASKSESEGEVRLKRLEVSSQPRAIQEGLRERPMSLISAMSSALSVEEATLSTSVVHNTTIAVNRTTQLTLNTVNLLNVALVGVTRLNRDLGQVGESVIDRLHIQAADTSPLFDLHPVAFLSDEGLLSEYSASNLDLKSIYAPTGSVLFNATGEDRVTAEQRLRLWQGGFRCHNAFYLLDCDDMSREPYKPVCDIAPSSSPEPIPFP